MTENEFLKRWVMHYVHPEYFYIPWVDYKKCLLTIDLRLLNSPTDEVDKCYCSFYLYSVTANRYIELSWYSGRYVARYQDISQYQSGDKITVYPCMTKVTGSIDIMIPYGDYQYIEYECYYGKINKQPIAFTINNPTQTLVVNHQAAYDHGAVGSEITQTITPITISVIEDDESDPYWIYRHPSGGKYFAGSYDNSDKPSWNIGSSVQTATGRKVYSNEAHWFIPTFDTTMDWDVTLSFNIERNIWDEGGITYGYNEGKVKFVPNGGESDGLPTYSRHVDLTRYDQRIPHYSMFTYADGKKLSDSWGDPFQELNPHYSLTSEDNVDTSADAVIHAHADPLR